MLTSADVISSPEVELSLLDRMGNCLGSRGQIHDNALADPLRRLNAHTQDADGLVILHPPHQGAHLGGTNIDAYNNFFHNH